MSAPSLLIVEDDHKLRRLLSEYFEGHGFAVASEENGQEALRRLRQEPPTLVVLDLMLPGMDGFEVCQQARTFFQGGIIMLTARQAVIDQALGLENGADDYVVKPVEPRVLLARVRSLMRRIAPQGSTVSNSQELRSGPLEVSRDRREALLHDEVLDLTSTEFDVLFSLASNLGEPMSREELYRDVRGIPYDGIDRGMDIHVSRIRRKLVAAGGSATWIKSVRGIGYMLVRIP
jgi:two-component system response regulator RstA